MPDESVFGDDTNATPLSKLNVPQVTSNSGRDPLQAPVYSPDVPVPEKQVRFADPPEQQHQQRPQPPRPPPPQQQQQPRQRYYRHPPPPQQPPHHLQQFQQYPPPSHPQQQQYPHHPSSKHKLAGLVDKYARRVAVFLIVCLVLYWYGALVRFPYIGDATSTHMTVFGITTVGLRAGSLFGIAEFFID